MLSIVLYYGTIYKINAKNMEIQDNLCALIGSQLPKIFQRTFLSSIIKFKKVIPELLLSILTKNVSAEKIIVTKNLPFSSQLFFIDNRKSTF